MVVVNNSSSFPVLLQACVQFNRDRYQESLSLYKVLCLAVHVFLQPL